MFEVESSMNIFLSDCQRWIYFILGIALGLQSFVLFTTNAYGQEVEFGRDGLVISSSVKQIEIWEQDSAFRKIPADQFQQISSMPTPLSTH